MPQQPTIDSTLIDSIMRWAKTLHTEKVKLEIRQDNHNRIVAYVLPVKQVLISDLTPISDTVIWEDVNEKTL